MYYDEVGNPTEADIKASIKAERRRVAPCLLVK